MKRSLMLQRRFKVTTAIITLTILGLVLPSCSRSPEEASITLGIIQAEMATSIYVAESQHVFESNGLKLAVKNYDTGVGTVNALLNGDVDIAMAAEYPIIGPALEKQSIQIFAVNDRFENDYLMVRNDRGINSPTDLKGKRIGVIKGTILEFYLGRYLELNGVSLKDVTIVNTENTSQTTNAIVNGDLDAVVAFQPYVNTIQTEMGSEVLTWAGQSNQLVYGVFVSRSDWLKGNSDVAQRFIEALSEADDYVAAHPDTAKEILREKMNLDSSYVTSIWPQHQFSLSLDFSLIAAMTDEARWMISNTLTPETNLPDFSKFIYTGGLKAVKPETVNINP